MQLRGPQAGGPALPPCLCCCSGGTATKPLYCLPLPHLQYRFRFSQAVATSASRAQFINKTMAWLDRFGFDGCVRRAGLAGAQACTVCLAENRPWGPCCACLRCMARQGGRPLGPALSACAYSCPQAPSRATWCKQRRALPLRNAAPPCSPAISSDHPTPPLPCPLSPQTAPPAPCP